MVLRKEEVVMEECGTVGEVYGFKGDMTTSLNPMSVMFYFGPHCSRGPTKGSDSSAVEQDRRERESDDGLC